MAMNGARNGTVRSPLLSRSVAGRKCSQIDREGAAVATAAYLVVRLPSRSSGRADGGGDGGGGGGVVQLCRVQ